MQAKLSSVSDPSLASLADVRLPLAYRRTMLNYLKSNEQIRTKKGGILQANAHNH